VKLVAVFGGVGDLELAIHQDEQLTADGEAEVIGEGVREAIADRLRR
jgi:hypothetical protein